MIIATNKCFLKAEAIHFVTIEESVEEDYALIKEYRKRQKGKRLKRNEPLLTRFTIKIRYSPSTTSGLTRDYMDCSVYCYDKETAHKLYADIVRQYREQNPDDLYLAQIAERFLGGSENDVASKKKVSGIR